MENPSFIINLVLFLLAFLLCCHALRAHDDLRLRSYVVHVEEPDGGLATADDEALERWHSSFLPNATLASGQPRLLHSYRHVLSGFVARLTASELEAMQGADGFLHARPDYQLAGATTYTTWSHLGLSQPGGLWQSSGSGEGMIIGMIDSGITPHHPSFADGTLGAPPAAWKGRCDLGGASCGKKLIGAVGFLNGASVSPVDEHGHGTHTAGTAAGAAVRGAEVLGNAEGTSAGAAPRAHLAVYRVLDSDNAGQDSDFLKGVDRAIGDGVDVLSMSLGLDNIVPLYQNGIAIASFAAIAKGIFPSVAAMNNGPAPSTIRNDAPWVLTVGASSLDRRIAATIRLGDGTELNGQSAYQPQTFTSTQLQLVFPGADGSADGLDCQQMALDRLDVKGKIVACMFEGNGSYAKGKIVRAAGGAAMLLMNSPTEGFTTYALQNVLPSITMSYSDALKIQGYFRESTSPSAAILFNGTQFGARPSPAVAFFSGRGPSLVNAGIPKPDILGPGVNVLAAWPSPTDNSGSRFNFLSGTSMATPHLSGIAAMLKKNHPQWSPAAIKSAMMTTADAVDNEGLPIKDESTDYRPASIFAAGAGLVNPARADDPGLVYDIKPDDYISYLCAIYDDTQVRLIVRREISCSGYPITSVEQLNYPSIGLSLGPAEDKTIRRTLTNVGGELNYTLRIVEPEGVHVAADTYNLGFSRVDEQKSFELRFSTNGGAWRKGEYSEGRLEWVSQRHTVRSPIVVNFA